VAWFLFTLCCSLLGLDEIDNHCENQKLVAVIFYRIHKYLNFISTLICMFLVGVSVEYCFQKFKKEHHVTDYKQALKLTDELTKEYRALKKGISPLLFLLLSPTVGSLITYTYTASVQFSNEIWVGAYILKLTYVCYIMEDCYEAFSSIPLRIRPSLVGATQEHKDIFKNCIYEIREQTPFVALGFFKVGWRTLTDITNLTVTYLVVMVRFH